MAVNLFAQNISMLIPRRLIFYRPLVRGIRNLHLSQAIKTAYRFENVVWF
jgi:hypothetical protein